MSHRSSSYDGHFDHYHHISQTSHSVFSGNVSWVPITRRSGTCWEWSCCSSFWFACVKLTFSIFVGHFVFDQFHFYQICFHRFEGCHLQVGRQQELSQVSRRNLGYFFVDTYIYSFLYLSLNMLLWTYISNCWEYVLYSYDHMTAKKYAECLPVHSCSTFRRISELCDLEVVCNIWWSSIISTT